MLIDTTHNLLLLSLPLLGEVFKSGATYRPTNQSFPVSCQYWQPPKLAYMNSGFNRYVVGVGKNLWRQSQSCGQCLEVTNQLKTIIVVIADYCPPPCTPMQLDLNQEASAALNPHRSQPRNHFDLQVRLVECQWPQNLTFHLDKGSSVYNWYMIPLYVKQPLKSVMVRGQQATHDLYGRWVIGFKHKFPVCNKSIEVMVNYNEKVFVDFKC